MIELSAHVRISTDPRAIDIGPDKSMAVANAAASIPIVKTDTTDTVWLSLTAFGKVADTLLRHNKGELMNVYGQLQLSRWRGQDGAEREQWSLIVQGLISARTTRPKGGRRS